MPAGRTALPSVGDLALHVLRFDPSSSVSCLLAWSAASRMEPYDSTRVLGRQPGANVSPHNVKRWALGWQEREIHARKSHAARESVVSVLDPGGARTTWGTWVGGPPGQVTRVLCRREIRTRSQRAPARLLSQGTSAPALTSADFPRLHCSIVVTVSVATSLTHIRRLSAAPCSAVTSRLTRLVVAGSSWLLYARHGIRGTLRLHCSRGRCRCSGQLWAPSRRIPVRFSQGA